MKQAVVSLTASANQALDKQYRQIAGPVLLQVSQLCTSPTSPLQQVLAELEREAARLEQSHESMRPDNAVLLKALQITEQVFNATAMLIQSNDDKIEVAGSALAVPVVTAKVFTSLTDNAVVSGIDPLSPAALSSYMKTIRDSGLVWRIP